jgi:glycosyltransferase involved in cell wall biosynthesis/GNAT superfamily N-acetyltransferase
VPTVVRVLWVVKGLGPGGAERLLVAAANAHDRAAFDIECAYVLPWKDHLVAALEAAGVRTTCLSVSRRDPRWPARLAALVRAGAFDVVHVHSPLPGSVARLATRSMPASERPAVVSTEHNRWETHRLPTRLANSLTGRLDAEIFAVTDEVNASMTGRARDRVRTLRHGIDVSATAARVTTRASMRVQLGLSPDTVAIGTVANFRPQKDYPNLLRAAQRLRNEGLPIRVVAVGQGPLDVEIRAMAIELGLDGFVEFTGFRDDAVDVMAACDVFTLASRWEGLPVAVMEALALGLPIVATDVGGLREHFHDGVDAVLVPPNDPVALADGLGRLVRDPDERARLAAASRARADEFDASRATVVVEEVYRRVARRRSGDAATTPSPPAPPSTAPTSTPRAAPPAGAPASRSRGGAGGLDIRAATPDDRDDIVALLRRSLGSDDDPRYPALFAWKHDENPFGASPTWVAVDGERIAAVRALMRWEFVRGGTTIRAVRAVDTATDPDYQGRGLFTALTLHGVRAMEADGVDLVFNTPNSQSRPGYLKMGWRIVGRLPAAVRFAGPSGAFAAVRSRVPANRWSEPFEAGERVDRWLDRGGAARWLPVPPATDVRTIRTRIDEGFLRWRFATPLLHYRVVDDETTAVIARLRRRGDALELAVVASFGDRRDADRRANRLARDVGADYAIRLGAADPISGFAPLPGGGPVLTWRAVNDTGPPPLPNWALTLGDVELF